MSDQATMLNDQSPERNLSSFSHYWAALSGSFRHEWEQKRQAFINYWADVYKSFLRKKENAEKGMRAWLSSLKSSLDAIIDPIRSHPKEIAKGILIGLLPNTTKKAILYGYQTIKLAFWVAAMLVPPLAIIFALVNVSLSVAFNLAHVGRWGGKLAMKEAPTEYYKLAHGIKITTAGLYISLAVLSLFFPPLVPVFTGLGFALMFASGITLAVLRYKYKAQGAVWSKSKVAPVNIIPEKEQWESQLRSSVVLQTNVEQVSAAIQKQQEAAKQSSSAYPDLYGGVSPEAIGHAIEKNAAEASKRQNTFFQTQSELKKEKKLLKRLEEKEKAAKQLKEDRRKYDELLKQAKTEQEQVLKKIQSGSGIETSSTPLPDSTNKQDDNILADAKKRLEALKQSMKKNVEIVFSDEQEVLNELRQTIANEEQRINQEERQQRATNRHDTNNNNSSVLSSSSSSCDPLEKNWEEVATDSPGGTPSLNEDSFEHLITEREQTFADNLATHREAMHKKQNELEGDVQSTASWMVSSIFRF